MKKILILCIIIETFVLIFTLMYSFSRKEKDNENIYSLNCNYSFLYDNDMTFDVVLFSNNNNPSFKYNKNCSYYLTDYNKEFIHELDIKEIQLDILEEEYIFTLTFFIPKISEIYIEKCYLNIINEKFEYNCFIGSYCEIVDDATSDLSYESISGLFIEKPHLTLDSVEIVLNKDIEILKIYSNSEYEFDFAKVDNKLVIKIPDKNYYTNNLFFYLITSNGLMKVNNFTYGINEKRIINYYSCITPVIRGYFNDSI